MTQIGNIILDQKQIDHKIRRIAYQIYENNVSEKEVVIASNNYFFFRNIVFINLISNTPNFMVYLFLI